MRKICVVTGSRAEYGLLKPLLDDLQKEPKVELQLAVTGSHLSADFGSTHAMIEEDGFAIDAKVDMLQSSDSRVGCAKSLGRGVIGFAEAFEKLQPDLVVLLGDRFEILAAAEAAMVERVPIAHLHGGEVTEGAMDDCIRHAITKMSHLHFVATEDFRRRVIQLGEDPARIFAVGATGLDALDRLELLDRAALEEELGLRLRKPSILVTYHPETVSRQEGGAGVDALLEALDAIATAQVFFTQTNADPGHRAIDAKIGAWLARNARRARGYGTLGQRRYLSLLREVDVVAGNSSSAIIEAPALGTPTVNIGDRQKGRPRADSVIDCPATAGAIQAALEKALAPGFSERAAKGAKPYGGPGATQRIVAALTSTSLDGLLAKPFHDLRAHA